MIVGFGHQAQVGKDTAAGMLVARHGFTRLGFADILKEVLYDINPIVAPFSRIAQVHPWGPVRLQDVVDEDGWDVAKGMTETRRLLQDLGVAARWHLDEDVWVKPVLAAMLNNPGPFVISDVRFPNEFRALKNSGALMVKITRTGVESNAGQHLSETALDNAEWDWVVPNDGTLLELEETLVDLVMLA